MVGSPFGPSLLQSQLGPVDLLHAEGTTFAFRLVAIPAAIAEASQYCALEINIVEVGGSDRPGKEVRDFKRVLSHDLSACQLTVR